MQTFAQGSAQSLLAQMLPTVILAVWLAVVTWTMAVCRAAATGDELVMPATGIDLLAARYAANSLTHNLSHASTPLGTGESSSRLEVRR